jgi:GWxTD domain-containing protein
MEVCAMRKSGLLLLIVVIAMLFVLDAGAEAQQDRIASWLDYACFEYPLDPSLTLVEFYYGMFRHQLTFADVDTGYVATVFVWIEILDVNGSALDTLCKKIATMVNLPSETNNEHVRLADQITATLPPGSYTARLTVEDVESQSGDSVLSGKVGQRWVKLDVPNFSAGLLTMSGVELSYRIGILPPEVQVTDYGALDKSRRRVVPNPSRIFIDQDSVMFFYAEVYNLAFGIGMNKEYHVACKILDAQGETVSDYGRVRNIKPGSSAIASSAIDIHDLPEGNYMLSLEVTDGESGAQVRGSKPFQILAQKPSLAPGPTADTISDADLQLLESMLKYVLSVDEQKSLHSLTREGKLKFIDEYWRRSDPDPSTRINEFRVELFRRVRYANERFSVNIAKKNDGWQTDRGRVFIVYGDPDEIESFPSSQYIGPFEKWNYFQLGSQGARFFIFEDETGYGDYRLAHSDAKGEPIDPEWEQRIEDGLMNYY